MKEQLKWIKGYEGLYKISNLGYVLSMPRKGKNEKSPTRLKGSLDGSNKELRRVCLSKNGYVTKCWVHKLLKEYFDK